MILVPVLHNRKKSGDPGCVPPTEILAALTRIASEFAQIAAAFLQDGFQCMESGRCLHQRNAGVEMMDDVVLHPHRQDIAEPALEAARVAIPARVLAWMVRHPREIVRDVRDGDVSRQPPEQRCFDRVSRPGADEQYRVEHEVERDRVHHHVPLADSLQGLRVFTAALACRLTAQDTLGQEVP